MKKVECLENFGTWCREGNVLTVSNERAKRGEKKGYLKILKDIPYEEHFKKVSKYILKEKVREAINKLNLGGNIVTYDLKKELDL